MECQLFAVLESGPGEFCHSIGKKNVLQINAALETAGVNTAGVHPSNSGDMHTGQSFGIREV